VIAAAFVVAKLAPVVVLIFVQIARARAVLDQSDAQHFPAVAAFDWLEVAADSPAGDDWVDIASVLDLIERGVVGVFHAINSANISD